MIRRLYLIWPEAELGLRMRVTNEDQGFPLALVHSKPPLSPYVRLGHFKDRVWFASGTVFLFLLMEQAPAWRICGQVGDAAPSPGELRERGLAVQGSAASFCARAWLVPSVLAV